MCCDDSYSKKIVFEIQSVSKIRNTRRKTSWPDRAEGKRVGQKSELRMGRVGSGTGPSWNGPSW